MEAFPFLAQAQKPTPVLVELFTSEGCSSCPPADALLRQLQGTTTAEGQMIVALSEHVTYWNRLGWADPYSQEIFTDRQSGYSGRFHLSGVYTPQAVVNGDHEMLGSDRGAILQAVREPRKQTAVAVHLLSAKSAGDKVAFTYSLDGVRGEKAPEIYAVVAEDMASTNVLRGENSGRKLAHVAIARSMTRVTSGSGTVTVPANLRGAEHLVLFAQEPGYGRVLSIDTRELSAHSELICGGTLGDSPVTFALPQYDSRALFNRNGMFGKCGETPATALATVKRAL